MDRRHPALRLVLWALSTGALSGCGAPEPDSPPDEDLSAISVSDQFATVRGYAKTDGVDHHVHLLGPDLLRDWKALGVPFSRSDSAYLTPEAILGPPGGSPPSDGVIGRAALVSMAHAYGQHELREALQVDIDEERLRVRRENDHVTAEALRWPGRAVALCSAPLLRPYAVAELERCVRRPGAAGIKLHLASSEIDLRRTDHLGRIAAVLAWAEREHLPVLLHLDTQRRGTSTSHVRAFAREVLGPHPDLILIVAHLGGSGGYEAWTRSVFRTLAE